MAEIYVKENSRQPIAEAYRMLRTNIKYTSLDKEVKTIIVTSSEPGDGKSTTSSNLAEAISQDDNRVLFIDCDLRKPVAHKTFGISNSKGLSDILCDNTCDVDSCIQKRDNIDILTSGRIPPNPSELLGSKRMKNLIHDFRDKYDYVVIDTAPIMAAADAQILSGSVDGVILVTSSNKTNKKSLTRAQKVLEHAKANILGVVLNNYETTSTGSYYYYYYKDGEKKKKNRRGAKK